MGDASFGLLENLYKLLAFLLCVRYQVSICEELNIVSVNQFEPIAIERDSVLWTSKSISYEN